MRNWVAKKKSFKKCRKGLKAKKKLQKRKKEVSRDPDSDSLLSGSGSAGQKKKQKTKTFFVFFFFTKIRWVWKVFFQEKSILLSFRFFGFFGVAWFNF